MTDVVRKRHDSVEAPTDAELAAAPILEGWLPEAPLDAPPWLYGWFFGHPSIQDGDHGHTAPIVRMDEGVPPDWVWTEGRLYRLGRSYPPAEREIRYWSQKLRLKKGLSVAGPPGGGDDIESMIGCLRSARILPERKLTRMEEAYRMERVRFAEKRARPPER